MKKMYLALLFLSGLSVFGVAQATDGVPEPVTKNGSEVVAMPADATPSATESATKHRPRPASVE